MIFVEAKELFNSSLGWRNFVNSPLEQGGSVILPGTWVSFSSPPTIRRATVEIFEPTFTLA
jgi:hypothetical protein